ncbi:T9SS type A sorting domain-containing protein [Spirosoma sp. HMF4905]|uniref:T9SS type A sorting domain-containing protein n=1 Tax=Spirosoma arboris TaxID=2682092 RepID=A0A7K1SQN2_9BACT|nr:T9SS type A sorting domain-containing protein [Spirosoma arboris]MVM35906.1 T9SS type A sorting domain-containing protein [Spirosoma arboris]
MKTSLCLITLLFVGSCGFAQQYPFQLTLTRFVEAGEFSEQQAVQTIESSSVIKPSAIAQYKAGQSVLLQPGFVAHSGSLFMATIGPVERPGIGKAEGSLSVSAYPNPFVDQVLIEYILTQSERVGYELRTSQGQLVHQTAASQQSEGSHQVTLTGTGLAAGVYLYQIQIGARSYTLRLVKRD